jgi:hypothetical protein
MSTLRMRVMPFGRGYLAESQVPAVTAFGSSAEEAAENGRRMALALWDCSNSSSRASTLIVRIDEPGRSAIAMQLVANTFSLANAGKECGSAYFDSEGNQVATR